MHLFQFVAFFALLQSVTTTIATASPDNNKKQCKRTKVAVLGAGVAGITAAQALNNASVTDFVIIEYQDRIGGRVQSSKFGKGAHGPYTVELGANWVQGIGVEGGPINPIWTLAQKWKVVNTPQDLDSIETFDQTGAADYKDFLDEYDTVFEEFGRDAGDNLKGNLQDRSARAGLNLVGWKPKQNMHQQAIEWYEWDYEFAFTPEESSQLFDIAAYNTTFYQFSDENNFVHDPRGFSSFIRGEASEFLTKNDPRLMLNTVVKKIKYSEKGVSIYAKDGSCMEADYAICTFSLGVLKNDLVEFSPALPKWKQLGMAGFEIGTYTKIFLQFPADKIFWNQSTQFFLYADPYERGYYPIWQSLDTEGFIPGSGILFVTVVNEQSYPVDLQDNEATKKQVMEVLRKMFGKDKVPDPIDFMYPRWSTTPWAMGSFSNWPPGTTLEMHQNFRANVGRLWFAGEATSAQFYGWLHGAWTEGQSSGMQIAECIKKGSKNCKNEKHYDVLTGTTEFLEYSAENGWVRNSFLTYGLDAETSSSRKRRSIGRARR